MPPADANTGPEAELPPGWDRKRVERRLLTLDSRRRIFEHVQNFPGVHLRQIVRELRLGLGTVEHHLHVLCRHGLVESRMVGPRRRNFFARDGRASPDKDLIAMLRGPSVRRVLECFLIDPDMDAPSIATRLQLSPATVGYHLQRLVQWQVLEELRVGRERMFRIKDTDRVRKVLMELADARPFESLLDRTDRDDDVLRYLLDRIPPDARAPLTRKEERTIRA